ncbi:two-component system response regulator [Chloroflexota bacterium]
MIRDSKGTVLVVDDSREIRLLCRTLLRRDGYNVLEAENGRRGLELATELEPDLILLDLVLPDLDGFRVLEEVRANHRTRSVPVIMLTALEDKDKIQRAIELGANDYIVKGRVSPNELLSKVRSLLPGSDMAKDLEVYRLSIKGEMADAPKLAQVIALTGLFQCPHCGADVLVELYTRPQGRWFTAHFVCSGCEKSF